MSQPSDNAFDVEAGPWHITIMQSFSIALQKPSSGNSFYGSWNRLLLSKFSPTSESSFMVIPPVKFPNNLFEVEKNSHPVLLVQIHPLSNLSNPTRRKEADNQMRKRLGEYGPTSLYPVLHGISVFGTKMCHLQYTHATGLIEPDRGVDDVAPEDQWSEDILQVNGADLFSAITNDVLDMCSHRDPS